MRVYIGRANLLHWRVGSRIEWREWHGRPGRLLRMWRWLTKQNFCVCAIDFETGELVIGRCR